MNNDFATIDIIVFASYALIILSVGLWVSRNKKGKTKSAEDYFLASKSLPWWAIGASLIAANISAEQFIGMSGSGFALGLAIASYEWMAAITLLVVGKYFLPIFIEKKLYTIPEFIEKRYSTNLKTILAVFWIALFIFVNLTTVLYLGGKALDTIIGSGDGSIILISIVCLGFFAAAYSLWGGLAAVAWTDVIQVILLIFGGLLMTYFALTNVTDSGNFIEGLKFIYNKIPERFTMILSKGEIITPNGRDAWNDLPGIAVLVGGMWVANLYYWGFDEDTEIKIGDKYKKIKDIIINIENEDEIYGYVELNADDVIMYNYNGITVSGNTLVKDINDLTLGSLFNSFISSSVISPCKR